MPRNRNTPQELTLCTYAALYDARDFGGVEAIYSLGFRSLASIKMKIQNIAAMFDEEGVKRYGTVKGLSGKPKGESGRRTDWEFVSKYSDVSTSKHLAECFAVLEDAQKLPGDIGFIESYQEGATRTIKVNVYERNPRARKACIEFYGVACSICGIDFGVRYGELAQGFIHVHHLKPLSEIGGEYSLDPIQDLRPVCPNCHSVIHLGNPAFSIEEVKALLKSK